MEWSFVLCGVTCPKILQIILSKGKSTITGTTNALHFWNVCSHNITTYKIKLPEIWGGGENIVSFTQVLAVLNHLSLLHLSSQARKVSFLAVLFCPVLDTQVNLFTVLSLKCATDLSTFLTLCAQHLVVAVEIFLGTFFCCYLLIILQDTDQMQPHGYAVILSKKHELFLTKQLRVSWRETFSKLLTQEFQLQDH